MLISMLISMAPIYVNKYKTSVNCRHVSKTFRQHCRMCCSCVDMWLCVDVWLEGLCVAHVLPCDACVDVWLVCCHVVRVLLCGLYVDAELSFSSTFMNIILIRCLSMFYYSNHYSVTKLLLICCIVEMEYSYVIIFQF